MPGTDPKEKNNLVDPQRGSEMYSSHEDVFAGNQCWENVLSASPTDCCSHGQDNG